MKKKYFGLLATMLGALGLAGCGGGDDGDGGTGGGEGKKLRIAVVPKGTNHTFWKTVQAGATKASGELGVELLWKGPVGEGDREGQIKVVENFVSQGVDAIAVAPLDDVALVRPVKEAAADGIKVVIWDSGLDDSGKEFYGCFVATDNFAAGVKCGKKLAELLDGKGKAIMLRYEVGSASTKNREEGFLKGLGEAGPEIEILSSDQFSGGTVEKAQEASNNLLNQFGDRVDGIFTPNESSTEGMLLAMKTAGIDGKVKFVGFDVNAALLAGIEQGQLHATAVQDPFTMGQLAVRNAVALVKGEEVEAVVDTGSVILTKENLSDDAVQELVKPDLTKWLGQ